ncbi:uracil-DNA glycosylase family protein [Brachyspira innocens]|uniref:uracil-DNA glycosylase family protein n=1 Tax=Brachyspira innocens TaxID=13264 RepID=UPI0026ECD5B7|nr:uracil-DNA glycosylase family protein [Brachyspira innocens]
MNIERHLFSDINFFPDKMRVLILGTFPVPNYSNIEKFKKLSTKEKENAWYYSSKKSEFWKIISYSFNTDYNNLISSKQNKKKLFEENKVGIADVFSKCDRKNKDSARDTDLIILEYNNILSKIITNKDLELIIFTSRFTENHFFKLLESNKVYYIIEESMEVYDHHNNGINDKGITLDIINALRERYLYINNSKKIKLATITLKISPIKGVSLYNTKKELYKYYLTNNK